MFSNLSVCVVETIFYGLIMNKSLIIQIILLPNIYIYKVFENIFYFPFYLKNVFLNVIFLYYWVFIFIYVSNYHICKYLNICIAMIHTTVHEQRGPSINTNQPREWHRFLIGMSHQRPNHRRRRKKYAIVEPHEPRLIHHISTITNERRNKGGKEYSSPRRSKTRNGSSASKIVEKESKEKLSRVVCISRLSKANKLNHKCMH